MKVWISRYALTKGIFEVEVKQSPFYSDLVSSQSGYPYYHKPDWHETKEEAIKRAEQMRVKKIASLRKQIEKLENLDFERGAI